METLAGAWYQSSLLWTIVGILAGVLVGALGAWATLRASYPKLRLNIQVDSITRLLAATSVQDQLTVSYNGATLHDPHLLVFDITNTGRRDITADMFHGGEATAFDFGEPIVALMQWQGVSPSAGPRYFTAHGSELSMKPLHVARKQKISISILFDGPVETLESRPSLVNVELTTTREREVSIWAFGLGTVTRTGLYG
ncbi:hypothetical protein [Streptomyces sp. NBC_01198]|uniref:hypothetical protein n=1 Tax=Streptomyces sp. NBC_01198 TaxID=2903769 RepID=UPI002E0D2FE1|nr:hypothetical protein OG702_32100 [Streptomyces sp. NBC_01198]